MSFWAVMVGEPASDPRSTLAVPAPLAKETVAVALPEELLEALKTPVDEVVVRASEMPPVPALALLPYWSASWKPSAVFVLEEALDALGGGVIVTWTENPRCPSRRSSRCWSPVAEAETLYPPEVVLAVMAGALA